MVGVLALLRQQDSPRYPSGVADARSLVTGVSLDQILPDWLAREPENPFVAVFAPLMIDDDAVLQARAPALWRTVQTAPLAVCDVLSQVLAFWFFERFRGLTAKEIWAMLNLVTPIQETRAYQSIFAEGKVEGKTEGEAAGKVSTLKRQLTRHFGTLPAWGEQRIDAAPLTQLDAWLDGIFDAASLADLIGPEGDRSLTA